MKTQKKRSFPVNPKLAALLRSIKPEDATGETKVFPAPKGGWIDAHNLANRPWHIVLERIGIEYRKLYQTRHTFITAALETPIMMSDGKMRFLEAKDIAKLVVTSAKIIYEHGESCLNGTEAHRISAAEVFVANLIITAQQVESALVWTANLTNITPTILRQHPSVLPILRMATAPPIARDLP
ncbi:MAG: XamI family restriction endonuclease [Tolypothrix brevis GSE-NOS-MK-07-07A]|nr:XamI family restriction endonuclease [Tolypothrix brevis GSE-NOS-MK-07-07A]